MLFIVFSQAGLPLTSVLPYELHHGRTLYCAHIYTWQQLEPSSVHAAILAKNWVSKSSRVKSKGKREIASSMWRQCALRAARQRRSLGRRH